MTEQSRQLSWAPPNRFRPGILKEMGDANQIGETIQQNGNFLFKIHDTMDILIVVLSLAGEVVYLNPACERLLGYTAEEIKIRLMTGQLALPQEIGAIKALFRNIRDGNHTGYYENEWAASSGEVYTIAWSIKLLLDEAGKAEYILATGTDITRLRAVETLLRREELLLQSLIDSIPDLIFFKDRNGAYLGCNKSFEKQIGLASESIIGRRDIEIYPVEVAQSYMESDRSVLESGEAVLYENWTKNSAGEAILIETRKTPFYGSDGEILGVIGIGRNITRHRMAEDALRQAKSEIEQLINSLSSVLIVITRGGRVMRWNPMAQTILGLPAEEAHGRSFQELPIRWEWDKVLESIRRCEQEQRPVFPEPIRFTRPDGKEGFLGVSVSPIRGESKALSGFILLCGDITERKRLESRLAQAQKLESIGQLAAGIAHEINTPIQYIGSNIEFLQESFGELITLAQKYQKLCAAFQQGEASSESLEGVEIASWEENVDFLGTEIPLAIQQSLEGIRRVAEIIQALKVFSHPGIKEKTYLDINQAIESTITVARNEWKYVATVETDLCETLPKVLCIPGEINQVFLNILVNAAHAIAAAVKDGEKGKITVKTGWAGDWVEIRIQDTGVGIPEAIQGRIFEPFFTTKEVGKGTGQGLAIAYDVVERKHKGTLTFETKPGVGTSFIIRLPINPSPSPTPSLPLSSVSSSR